MRELVEGPAIAVVAGGLWATSRMRPRVLRSLCRKVVAAGLLVHLILAVLRPRLTTCSRPLSLRSHDEVWLEWLRGEVGAAPRLGTQVMALLAVSWNLVSKLSRRPWSP